MKKAATGVSRSSGGDMRPEYDFTAGVRGKHHRAFRQGYTVKIHQPDGTTVIQRFEPDEGTVVLDPDVRQHFPDSDAVNAALRSLIPAELKKAVKKARSSGRSRRFKA